MSYHDRIMNMPIPGGPGGESVSTASSYCHGHRDARHAAAEIATEADTLIVDLSTALEEAIRWIGKLRDWAGPDDPDVDTWRAALAKARGEE